MTGHEAAAERARAQALEWRAWATGERKKPPHNLLAFTTDVLALAAALSTAQEREKALREALAGLDAPIRWLGDHYPAAMEAMPTDLWRRFADAGAALAPADTETP